MLCNIKNNKTTLFTFFHQYSTRRYCHSKSVTPSKIAPQFEPEKYKVFFLNCWSKWIETTTHSRQTYHYVLYRCEVTYSKRRNCSWNKLRSPQILLSIHATKPAETQSAVFSTKTIIEEPSLKQGTEPTE